MMDTSSRRSFFRNSLLLESLACRGGAEDVANAQGNVRRVIDDARSEPVGALAPVPILAPGARIALVAPGGALAGRTDLDRAMANVRRCGWEPVAGTNALSRDGYFAGSDQERLDDIKLRGQLAVWATEFGKKTDGRRRFVRPQMRVGSRRAPVWSRWSTRRG